MIRVNDDYVIDLDSLIYTVKRDLHHKKILKDRRADVEIEVDAYTTVGFYSDLTAAIKGVIKDMNDRALRDGVHTLEEAVNIVVENNRRVSELLERALEI